MTGDVAMPVDETAVLLEKWMTKIVWAEYRRCARELSVHQLTYPQFHTLLAIRRTEPACTMGLLAEETNQVSATVTGIIDRLVERGLVERFRPPDDRRQVMVRLTDEGREKLEHVFDLRQRHVANVLAHLDVPVQQQLVSVLKKYMDVMETVVQNGNGR